MITPDFETFRQLAKRGNRIAVVRSLPADLDTPVSSFLKLADDQNDVFLLESAEQEEKIGRYSILGLAQDMIVRETAGKVICERPGSSTQTSSTLPILDYLKSELKKCTLANPESVPGFQGGFVGYLSYERIQDFETVRLKSKNGAAMPDFIFFLTREFLIFDHFRKTIALVTLAKVEHNKTLKKSYSESLKRLNHWEKRFQAALKMKKTAPVKKLQVTSNTGKSEFIARVKKIKEYIRAGDCIQVVLSQRFRMPAVGDDFQIYRALRSINPSPYMFYFRSGKHRLIGTSPELLVRKVGRKVEVRPIAGTRPRGKNAAEDQKLEENLKRSVKELAEHLMLVDLGRNDLGRVCQFNTVQVQNFARIERYSHVMHLVSDVTGNLRPRTDSFDLLKATFPAGTVSGAPKIRALEIIDELESEKRGPYAGCLGYFSFNHDMDMCITIRTLFSEGKNLFLQAGAGIVKDSIPEKEYEETLNKARALLRAVEKRGDF